MSDIPPSNVQLNAGLVTAPVVSSYTVGSKRQRKPSVRLADIGRDQHNDSNIQRPFSSAASVPWQWKPTAAAITKPSKTCPLTNLDTDFNNGKKQTVDIVKDSKKRGSESKRVKTKWVSRDNNSNVKEAEDNNSLDFNRENSDSPSIEKGPIYSRDNLAIERDNLRPIRTNDDNMRPFVEFTVRKWLKNLCLGRYAGVFEFHDIDGEILPWLTLEDLKEMGISSVGSRRKLFNAIQKLHKGKGNVQNRYFNTHEAGREKFRSPWDGRNPSERTRTSSGGVTRDTEGRWQFGFTRNIGACSVEQAELWGILDGLTVACSWGFTHVIMETDNNNVGELLNGNMKHNQKILMLEKIEESMQQPWNVRVECI